jgi:hypothetical protein
MASSDHLPFSFTGKIVDSCARPSLAYNEFVPVSKQKTRPFETM